MRAEDNVDERTSDRLLSEALRTLAADEPWGASPAVEVHLLAEVRAMARARRRAGMKLSAIAAGLLLIVSALVWSTTRTVPAVVFNAPVAVGEIAKDFLPLTYSTVPMTSGEIIRFEVPATALDAFGIEPGESQNGSRPGTVLADVLVGDDGLARAVRFVRP